MGVGRGKAVTKGIGVTVTTGLGVLVFYQDT